MIEVVAGERAPVATVVPIRGAGLMTGYLARYNIFDYIKHKNVSLLSNLIQLNDI